MSWQIDTHVGYGATLKLPKHYETEVLNEEGVIFGAFGDASGNSMDYGYYIIIKDAPRFKIDRDAAQTQNFNWCIKIPSVEQYQLDLWRDKIIAFCAKRNIEFDEPSWMVATFGG